MDCQKIHFLTFQKSVFYFLKQKNYDIIFLQETHFCFTDEKLCHCEWGGKFPLNKENISKGILLCRENNK